MSQNVWITGAIALLIGGALGYGGAQLGGSGTPTAPAPQAAATDAAPAEEEIAELTELRIGITGSERDSQRMERLDQFADYLSDRLGVPVSYKQASDYSAVTQAIDAGQVELAITGASNYANMYKTTEGGVEPLVTNREEDGSLGYYSALYVKADSPYQKLEDLDGKSIAYADPNSTSGYLFPRFAMREKGIDPKSFFAREGFAGGHPQAVIAVLQGQYDAGVTWVSGQGDPADGYTRGNLRMMTEAGQLDMNDIRVIDLFGPIPNGPIVIRKDVPQQTKDQLRGVLVALQAENPEIYEAISAGGGGGFAVVPHSFYEQIIRLREAELAARRAD